MSNCLSLQSVLQHNVVIRAHGYMYDCRLRELSPFYPFAFSAFLMHPGDGFGHLTMCNLKPFCCCSSVNLLFRQLHYNCCSCVDVLRRFRFYSLKKCCTDFFCIFDPLRFHCYSCCCIDFFCIFGPLRFHFYCCYFDSTLAPQASLSMLLLRSLAPYSRLHGHCCCSDLLLLRLHFHCCCCFGLLLLRLHCH